MEVTAQSSNEIGADMVKVGRAGGHGGREKLGGGPQRLFIIHAYFNDQMRIVYLNSLVVCGHGVYTPAPSSYPEADNMENNVVSLSPLSTSPNLCPALLG